MNPRHVTSLALSRKLKEAGLTAGSYFQWCAWPDGTHTIERGRRITGKKVHEDVSAWTSGELGEMLPTGAETWRNTQIWFAEFTMPGDPEVRENLFNAATEAEARGKLLLHLLTSGLLSVEELKAKEALQP